MSLRTAMIFAAGRGERMRPLTAATPKALLRVRGRMLIERLASHFETPENDLVTQWYAESDVEIIDGSGNIYVYNVDGSVDIDDGSGDIEVEDVGGDLWVRYDESGSIRYRNIRGIVDIP